MSSSSISGEVGAYEKERLHSLSQQPNTTVYKTEYESHHEPWTASRLRTVAEQVATKVCGLDRAMTDFQVRKTCLEDKEILAFKKQHTQLFMLLTDRAMLADTRFQQALGAMLKVREKVEAGEIQEGHDADGLAMSSIVSALQTSD